MVQEVRTLRLSEERHPNENEVWEATGTQMKNIVSCNYNGLFLTMV